jgi:replication initiation protein RepC
MAFIQVSARTSGARTVDRHGDATPSDIWAVFRALRDARDHFGLKPGHIQTLQALLSFLRPGQGDTVFASNLEICRRVGGIDERTLRRHIDRFIELGFMARHDSPNRKRYRVRSTDGQALSFGLSLAPLLGRAEELLTIADQLAGARQDALFLRKQILVGLATIEAFNPSSAIGLTVRRTLRRKLDVSGYQEILAALEAEMSKMSTTVDVIAEQLPASDGQIVRHQSKSTEEQKDYEHSGSKDLADVAKLTAVCQEAIVYSPAPLRTWTDIKRHAETLAPMMGIRLSTFAKACERIGAERAATAIFIVLQLGERVRNHAAYFHSLTLGQRASTFQPAALLNRLAMPSYLPS